MIFAWPLTKKRSGEVTVSVAAAAWAEGAVPGRGAAASRQPSRAAALPHAAGRRVRPITLAGAGVPDRIVPFCSIEVSSRSDRCGAFGVDSRAVVCSVGCTPAEHTGQFRRRAPLPPTARAEGSAWVPGWFSSLEAGEASPAPYDLPLEDQEQDDGGQDGEQHPGDEQ
ncbi:hypothetical protein ACVWXU_001672 [Streptomyces sp. TE33382]